MSDQKKRIITFGVLLIVLGSFFTVLNVKFPAMAEGLYAQRKIDLLKKISFTDEKQIRPPAYYIGKIEDAWVGPLTSLVSGGLFLLFCLWFLQGAGGFNFGAAAFLYLLLSRFQVLFYPPYGDSLFAVLSEPLWLVRHHLDWIGLLQQKTFALGGPLQYPESIYPQFIALLMYFSPSPQAFLLLNHLIVFAAGAVLVATLREILMEFCDAKRATLGAILFLALPIIQCQVELLNMEIVCACFAAACLLMVLRKNFFWASAMAAFSVIVKVPGAIAMPVLLGACLLSLFNEPDKKKFAANLSWVLGACAVAFYLLILRRDTLAQPAYPLNAWNVLRHSLITWLFFFLSALYLGRCAFRWNSRKKHERSFSAFLQEYYKSLAIFGIAACWFLSIFHAPDMIPRYTVLAVPFVLLFLVYLFSSFIKKENVFMGSMVAMIFFALLGSHGLYFRNQKITGDYSTNERSLEYRNVLKVYRRAAEELERDFSGFTLGANILMAQILTSPEAGYVSKPLKDVFVYGYGATHEGIRPYPGIQSINPKTIWIAETSADPYYLSNFPIGPADRIIHEIWAGNKRITLFFGGFSILDWSIASAKSQGWITNPYPPEPQQKEK